MKDTDCSAYETADGDCLTNACGGCCVKYRAELDSLRLALAEATRERSLLHERVCELVSLLQTAERERDHNANVVLEQNKLWADRCAAAERERDDATAAANIRAAEHRKERDLRAQAERERDEALRTVKALTPAANYCLEYKPLLLKAERERDEAVRVLRDIATFGWYAKGAKVARAYLAAREGR